MAWTNIKGMERPTLSEGGKLPVLTNFVAFYERMPTTVKPTPPTHGQLLERAIRLAAKVHKGQVDRFGQPFILHIMRVITHAKDPDERLLAAIHDVLERSELTIADLREKEMPEHVLVALTHISRVPDEDYDGYIDRVAQNQLATRVKVIDLADKMDLRDVGQLSVADLKRYNKQLAAYERLKHLSTIIKAEMTLSAQSRKLKA
jgi:(p)ppGpp synthase/HD superfamily hydrolase